MFSNFRIPSLAALTLTALTTGVAAQDAWPTSTVKVIVPYQPGATADGLPRILAEYLTQIWKQPVVLENRTGAGGNVGAEAAARAAPDGYTLLVTPNAPLTVLPHMRKAWFIVM